MRRLSLVILAALCLTTVVIGQTAKPRIDDRGFDNYQPRRTAGYLSRPSTLPAEDLPTASMRPVLKGNFGIPEEGADFGDEAELANLDQNQVLHRIARIVRYQSEMISAEAEGNKERSEQLLQLAMTDLYTLSQNPGVMDQPRFQELYRSLITEYEHRFGSTDTLNVQYGDVFQMRADMFSAIEEVKQPLLEDVMITKGKNLKPVGTAVQLTMNRLVEESIAYLLREPNKHLYRWMSRAETYFPMIEQVLREEGAPDEIKYLAMIESGLVPHAQSWAQAVGMWQFVAGTGKMYDLKINSYVDERRDPEKATRAAARHLKDLYRTFGDWQLALAGYNCGAGNVNKALRRLGKQKATFWEIYDYLPRETRGYVPMYIATALLVSNPDAFNLPRVAPGPAYEYHNVPIRGSVSLTAIARAAGTDVATIKALNPALRRNTLPGGKEPYLLRLPLGTYDRFAQEFTQVASDRSSVPSDEEHTVRRGERLSSIARRYGVTMSAIREANGMRSSALKAGQKLTIPGAGESNSGEPAQLVDAGVQTVRYGDRAIRPLLADDRLPQRSPQQAYRPPVQNANLSSDNTAAPDRTTPRQASATKNTIVYYKVKRGDTLAKVARQYGVSQSNIKKWNNLKRNGLLRGERLKIHQQVSGGAVDEPEDSNIQQASQSGERIRYKVRKGDYLSRIADRYGVTISQIKDWNNLRSNTLRAGQYLTIYQGDAAQSVRSEQPERRAVVRNVSEDQEPEVESRESSGTVRTHKVKRGETLAKIAARYGVTMNDIREWNGFSGSTVYAGQNLKIQGDGNRSESRSSAPTTTTYRVKRGDSLGEIATRHGVTVSQLKKWNNLRSNTIRAGQKLKIQK